MQSNSIKRDSKINTIQYVSIVSYSYQFEASFSYRLNFRDMSRILKWLKILTLTFEALKHDAGSRTCNITHLAGKTKRMPNFYLH